MCAVAPAVTALPVAAKPHGGQRELTFAGASSLQDSHRSRAWKPPPHRVDTWAAARGALSAGQRASERASAWGSQASDPGLSHGRRPGPGKPSSPGGQGLGFFSGRTRKHHLRPGPSPSTQKSSIPSAARPARGPRVLGLFCTLVVRPPGGAAGTRVPRTVVTRDCSCPGGEVALVLPPPKLASKAGGRGKGQALHEPRVVVAR